MDITTSVQYSNDVRTLAKAYITFGIGKFVFSVSKFQFRLPI